MTRGREEINYGGMGRHWATEGRIADASRRVAAEEETRTNYIVAVDDAITRRDLWRMRELIVTGEELGGFPLAVARLRKALEE